GEFRTASCPADVPLRDDADARDDLRAALRWSGAGVRGALLPGRGCGAGAGTEQYQRVYPRGEGRHRRTDRELPVLRWVRQDAFPAGTTRHRGASRGDAAEVPQAGGATRAG